MKTAKLFAVFVLTILVSACSNKKSLPKPDIFIDQDVMVNIITDLYLTDGLLNISKVRQSFQEKDSIEAYIDVINNYGFTKKDFDSNLDYYFISKPDKFTLIYESVVVRLSEMEAENNRKRDSNESITKNIWNQKTSFRLPEDATTSPVEFSIPIKGIGKYNFKFRATVFEDDQSADLTTNIYFWYDDGSESGVQLPFGKHVYKKNGRSEIVNLSINLTDDKYTHLKGRLFDHTQQSGHWEMHSSITGISISYRSPAGQNDPEMIEE